MSDHIAFFRYRDKPGVVAVVGSVLGGANINIAGMQVGRNDNQSIIVLTVDSPIPAEAIDAIVANIGAESGRAVDLA